MTLTKVRAGERLVPAERADGEGRRADRPGGEDDEGILAGAEQAPPSGRARSEHVRERRGRQERAIGWRKPGSRSTGSTIPPSMRNARNRPFGEGEHRLGPERAGEEQAEADERAGPEPEGDDERRSRPPGAGRPTEHQVATPR